MGNFRRLIPRTALGSAVLLTLLVAVTACSREKTTEVKRRELLTPPPVAAAKPKKVKPSIFDEKGVPLPSDQVLGGFVVPKGFELTRSHENEWFLLSKVVSAEAVSRYVGPRVFTGTIERTSVGGVRFEQAQLLEAPSLPRVSIWVTPIKGDKDAAELYIRRTPMKKVATPTAESVAKTLREKARYAQ